MSTTRIILRWGNLCSQEGPGHCIRHFFDHETLTTHERVVECDKWEFDHSVHHSTILEEWDLVCNNDYLKPFPQSLSMAGLIIGNVVFSHFSDHYGRRPAVFAGMLICAFSGVLATATNNFILFNVGRFFSSVSKIGIQASIVIYLESIDPHYRWVQELEVCFCIWQKSYGMCIDWRSLALMYSWTIHQIAVKLG